MYYAEQLERNTTQARRDFLRSYVEAQMVFLETGQQSGWFFWNIKMEGGYALEWDFLRGVKEGWIPQLPDPDVPCEAVFGNCYDILEATEDNLKAMEPFPDKPKWVDGWFPDDDTVNYRGYNMHKIHGRWYNYARISKDAKHVAKFALAVGLIVCLALFLKKKYRNDAEDGYNMFCMGQRGTYSKVGEIEKGEVVTSHSLYGSDSDH